ncbi:Fic family protein [Glaciecola sp. SC05]|uniref:Fic family protein n=1 Tax=Glaciecola sp. SC05 TaxID=1987355 RepID=UPI0035273C70
MAWQESFLSRIINRYLCGDKALKEARLVPHGILFYSLTLPHNDDPITSDLIGQITAYEEVVKLFSTRNVTIDTFHLAHRKLNRNNRPAVTSFRLTQNTVGSKLSGEVYRPPRPEVVNKAMDDLVALISQSISNDLFAIINIYVLFLKIHPYMDGNGRLARALMQGLLIKHGINRPHLDLFRFSNSEIKFSEQLSSFVTGNLNANEYWVSNIAWNDSLTCYLTTIINIFQKNLSNKVALRPMDTHDSAALQMLLMYPIFTPDFLCRALNIPYEKSTKLIEKFCRLNLLEPQQIRVVKNQVVYVANGAFEMISSFDQAIFSNKQL